MSQEEIENMTVAAKTTGAVDQISPPKNMTVTREYEPDQGAMVKALRIVLDLVKRRRAKDKKTA